MSVTTGLQTECQRVQAFAPFNCVWILAGLGRAQAIAWVVSAHPLRFTRVHMGSGYPTSGEQIVDNSSI